MKLSETADNYDAMQSSKSIYIELLRLILCVEGYVYKNLKAACLQWAIFSVCRLKNIVNHCSTHRCCSSGCSPPDFFSSFHCGLLVKVNWKSVCLFFYFFNIYEFNSTLKFERRVHTVNDNLFFSNGFFLNVILSCFLHMVTPPPQTVNEVFTLHSNGRKPDNNVKKKPKNISVHSFIKLLNSSSWISPLLR